MSRKCSITFKDEQFKELEELAERNHVSIAGIVRQIVDNHLGDKASNLIHQSTPNANELMMEREKGPLEEAEKLKHLTYVETPNLHVSECLEKYYGFVCVKVRSPNLEKGTPKRVMIKSCV